MTRTKTLKEMTSALFKDLEHENVGYLAEQDSQQRQRWRCEGSG